MAAATAPTTVDDWEASDESGVGSYAYFRRPDGSLCASDLGKNNYRLHERQNEGWTPLLDYGQFQWTGYAADHPFETLLMRGGAEEFTPRQLIEMGYHLEPDPQGRGGRVRYGPPIIPTCKLADGEPGHGGNQKRTGHHPRCWRGARHPAFPQVDASSTERGAVCAFCDDAPGTPVLVYATRRARDQHVKVMHQEELRAARMGQELGAVLAEKLGQMGLSVPDYACNRCTQTFMDIGELAAHVATHTDLTAHVGAQASFHAAAPARQHQPAPAKRGRPKKVAAATRALSVSEPSPFDTDDEGDA